MPRIQQTENNISHMQTEPTKIAALPQSSKKNSSKWLHGTIKFAMQQLAADIHNITQELKTHIKTKLS